MTQTMNQNQTAPLSIGCPGCQTAFAVAPGAASSVCPNCRQTVVYRRCGASGKSFPVLGSWTTWTHPGCAIRHDVAVPAVGTAATGPARKVRGKHALATAYGLIVAGIVLIGISVMAFVQPASATCNGESMFPGDVCQITGGSNPGSFGYQQMLAQSKSGAVGAGVVIAILGLALAVIGIASLTHIMKSRRVAKARVS